MVFNLDHRLVPHSDKTSCDSDDGDDHGHDHGHDGHGHGHVMVTVMVMVMVVIMEMVNGTFLVVPSCGLLFGCLTFCRRLVASAPSQCCIGSHNIW